VRNIVVNVPAIQEPITPSPGFAKKHLADYKLDIQGLCGFGCLYCSSNAGNYLRINRAAFAQLAQDQVGRALTPFDDPALTYVWPDVVPNLERQLDSKRPGFGRDQTLVFSMLTDGFSPLMVTNGTTERILRLVLERTEFRIRVLTKNAIVGQAKWRRLFAQHPGRFVVGLSIGTADDQWAHRVELGTSSPRARLRALRQLQDDGIPTYGMLCPVFPDVLDGCALEDLVEAIRPERVETVWAEPYNDRASWKMVQAGYRPGSRGWHWLERVYGRRDWGAWSAYATELYVRLHAHAVEHGWQQKFKYLLYEDLIAKEDASALSGLDGVLLQSKPDARGISRNPSIAALQQPTRAPREDERPGSGRSASW